MAVQSVLDLWGSGTDDWRAVLQFTHADSECYQLFLAQFAQAYPDRLNILQVDNGAFHKAKDWVVPDNIILLFQPPYCPELNPIERLWQHLKVGHCSKI